MSGALDGDGAVAYIFGFVTATSIVDLASVGEVLALPAAAYAGGTDFFVRIESRSVRKRAPRTLKTPCSLCLKKRT